VRSYTPEPFDNRVTLSSASQRPWFIRWDPMEQWGDIFTGPVEIVPIPGDHMSMLKPPQVDYLADKISATLGANGMD
jgi:thioesterase domain-containing protein